MGLLVDIYLDLGAQQGFETGKGVTGKQLNNPKIEVSVVLAFGEKTKKTRHNRTDIEQDFSDFYS